MFCYEQLRGEFRLFGNRKAALYASENVAPPVQHVVVSQS
jgi:hypothetical protein